MRVGHQRSVLEAAVVLLGPAVAWHDERHMRNPWYAASILAAALAFSALPLRADDPMEEAKAHVARAKVHYDLGEYEQAAEEYILVYRIKPIPAILFNVAQSYRQAGKYEKAR